MDIFNRAPAISEDTLQYKLYPCPEDADRASVTSLAACITSFVESLLPGFIWHRDAFECKVVADPDLKGKWMLEGLMRVGDSVDDEWCVVWLLREVCKNWDVAISVFDSDGEFLLIEAADDLPHWVTPTNSENRVWLYRSHLHLIPLSYLSPPSTRPKRSRYAINEDEDGDVGDDDDDGWINVQDALVALRSRDLTEASTEVEAAVWKRISGYPMSTAQHIHIAKAFVPIDIAKALSQNASLIQRAVETFYTRDASQLRVVHRMSRFPPKPDVLTPVRMTRTAYAQLNGQKFHPPKIFGQFKEREGTREWKWRDIGMKIACGFEMLFQESKSRSEGLSADSLKSSSDARKEALRRNVEYNEFISKLEASRYFKGELRDSRLWSELEDKAANVFINSKREDDAARPSFAFLVNSAVMQAGDTAFVSDLEEDSDDWLNLDADYLEQTLTETVRPGMQSAKEKITDSDAMDVDKNAEDDEETRQAKAQAENLKGLARKIERFVENEGTMEGAVFEDEKMSEDEEDGGHLSDFSEEQFSDPEDEQPQIDEVESPAAKAARQKAMENLVPGIDPAEYGKMPSSYYTTSQRVAPVTMETEVREEISAGNASNGATPSKGKSIRRPILPRDDFDGVDSDDETDGEEIVNESDEEEPQVVGEIEIDMSEEQEDFVRFSREALGITDEMWKDIVHDRESRGAFVPKGIDKRRKGMKGPNSIPESVPDPPKTARDSAPRLRSPQADPQPGTNPNLDSFEAVMEAMEAELEKARLTKNKGPNRLAVSTKQAASRKGKEKALASHKEGSDDEDIEAAMDSELRAALEHEDDDSGAEEPMDYGLIKNFLESFKSQAGLSGPVSNLAGRLEPGLKLPRDSN